MVKLTRIFTGGGDKGETSLGDGTRVAKHDRRIAAIGAVEEANAAIGLARLHGSGELDEILARAQNDLFDLGGDLCTPERENPEHPPLRITAEQVARLEREIEGNNAELAPLDSFVLPGGTPAAAHLHLARCMARRAEREITALAAREKLNPEAIRFINRLSDLFFVLSRRANDGGAKDVLWVAGANR